MMASMEDDDVVLTPIKHHDVTVVRVQRIPKALVDYDRAYHVAGGRYKGIVICEAVTGDVLQEAPHVLRELAVQLWDQASRVKLDKTTVVRERRLLRFWLKNRNHPGGQTIATKFINELLNPQHASPDYVGFIKQAAVQMVFYTSIERLELAFLPSASPSNSSNTTTRSLLARNGQSHDHVESRDHDESRDQDQQRAQQEVLDSQSENLVKILGPEGESREISLSGDDRAGVSYVDDHQRALDGVLETSLDGDEGDGKKALRSNGHERTTREWERSNGDLDTNGNHTSGVANKVTRTVVVTQIAQQGEPHNRRNGSQDRHQVDTSTQGIQQTSTLVTSSSVSNANSDQPEHDKHSNQGRVNNADHNLTHEGHQGDITQKHQQTSLVTDFTSVGTNQGGSETQRHQNSGTYTENYQAVIGSGDGHQAETVSQGDQQTILVTDTTSVSTNVQDGDPSTQKFQDAGTHVENLQKQISSQDRRQVENTPLGSSSCVSSNLSQEDVQRQGNGNSSTVIENHHTLSGSQDSHQVATTPRMQDTDAKMDARNGQQQISTIPSGSQQEDSIDLTSRYGQSAISTTTTQQSQRTVLVTSTRSHQQGEFVTHSIHDSNDQEVHQGAIDRIAMSRRGEDREAAPVRDDRLSTFVSFDDNNESQLSQDRLITTAGSSSGRQMATGFKRTATRETKDGGTTVTRTREDWNLPDLSQTDTSDVSTLRAGGYQLIEDSSSGKSKPFIRNRGSYHSISQIGRQVIWVARKQRLLDILQEAFPNTLHMEEIARLAGYVKEDKLTVAILLKGLMRRGYVNEMDSGRWMRIQSSLKGTESQHDFQVVKNIPELPERQQPTCAIITLLYAEKQAVDVMMDNKTTYVRYRREAGEAQVYTVGTIGKHCVVATKLSRSGAYEDEDDIVAGNAITRLLGTFSKVEHVFLVGVGGGVPHYTNHRLHVRLGDVLVSRASFAGPLYIFCNDVEVDKYTGDPNFEIDQYHPSDEMLNNIVKKLQEKQQSDLFFGRPWDAHLEEGLKRFQGDEFRFLRPAADTDKLVRENDDGTLCEVDHPVTPFGSDRQRLTGRPMIQHGVIGAFRHFPKENVRKDFSLFNDIKGFDCGFKSVMESLEGSKNESFLVVRGISDYFDGTRKKEWHPYCALAAAAYVKAVILALPVKDEDED